MGAMGGQRIAALPIQFSRMPKVPPLALIFGRWFGFSRAAMTITPIMMDRATARMHQFDQC
jgi:hypothetical protein